MPLTFGKNQDDLKSRRVADVLEQDRCATSLMISLLGPTRALGFPAADFGRGNSLRWS